MDGMEETITMTTASNDVDDRTTSDPQKIVFCSPCNLWFSDVLSYIRHYSQHEIQSEVQCLLCHESFRMKTLVEDHYRNFHNIRAAKIPAALPDTIDLDQTAHVDHSYYRADHGEHVKLAEVQEIKQGGVFEDGDIDEEDVEEERAKSFGEDEKMLLFDGEGEKDLTGEDTTERNENEVTEITGEGVTEKIGGEKKGEITTVETKAIVLDEEEEIEGMQEDKTTITSVEENVDADMGGEKVEIVEGDERIADDDTAEQERIRTSATVLDDGTPIVKDGIEIGKEELSELEFKHTEKLVTDGDGGADNKGKLDGSLSPGRVSELLDDIEPEGDRQEMVDVLNAGKGEEDSKEDKVMREMTEDDLEERMSPFDGETLDSIHSDHEDSNTFMERINLETGDAFEASFSGNAQDLHPEENTGEIVHEYQEGDFRFISGLRHRQVHIANSDIAANIGMHVFICLHCDFIDSEVSLVNHMKKVHHDVLDLEGTLLDYSKEVPEGRMFPENVTGEEVIRLSEYHRRNLQQKHLSNRGGKRTFTTNTQQEKQKPACADAEETPKKKKRYVENRMPCLCPECGKLLCRKSALRTHILGVHSRSRNHLCEVCGKAFRASYHLSQHRKSHRTKTFSCDLCDFTSDVRMEIFDHQQLHPNKFILCHVCGTVLKSKTALTRHMLVHSESRPFACTVEGCTWRFTSEALCKGHIESHSTPGEFICLECKRRFRKRHHIRRHLKTIHGKVSNTDADKYVAVDAKVVQSPEQYDQIPVTQLSKQHIVITTDVHGTPIFCDQNDSELMFDTKTSSLLQVTVKHSDTI